jgi:hypothetical protein
MDKEGEEAPVLELDGLTPGSSIRLKGVWLQVSDALWFMAAQVLLDRPEALEQAGLTPDTLSRSDLSSDMHCLHERYQVSAPGQ